MIPFFRKKGRGVEVVARHPHQAPPHLHDSLECFLVESGSFELAVSRQIYHMEAGDFAILFPGQIHSFQNFELENGSGIFVWASPSSLQRFLPMIQAYETVGPVIRARDLHPDIRYAMNSMREYPLKQEDSVIGQAFVSIIIERSVDSLGLRKRGQNEDNSLLCQVIAYVLDHFQSNLSLESIGHELGVSPYTLSRVFSKVICKNFKQYVNEIRLEYALSLLAYTNDSVTDICMRSGFGSQRTFNRAFQEVYHRSPREYRNLLKENQPETDPLPEDPSGNRTDGRPAEDRPEPECTAGRSDQPGNQRPEPECTAIRTGSAGQ